MEQLPDINKLFVYRNLKYLFSLILISLFPGMVQGTESLYEQRILQAQNGNYPPLLDYIQRYQINHTLNAGQVADWIQVASWAGHDEKVVRLWLHYQGAMPLPARAIAAAAQSYRNLKRWEPSLTLWQRARRLAPDNDDYRLGWIKTLADAHRDSQALREARQLVAVQPSAAHLQTLSYVYQRQGKSWDQLLNDSRAFSATPGDKEILNRLINALTLNRVSGPALKLSAQASLAPEQRRRQEADAAAELVRLADTASRGERRRFALAQQALERYDALFARWRHEPRAASDITRARIDRLGALHAHGYDHDVISEYESLAAQKTPVPGWALRWVISSYLAEKKVDSALALVRQHPELPPPAGEQEQDEMFYALMDSGQYSAARRYVGRITRSTPYARYDYGSPTPQPNDRWLAGQSLWFQYLLITQALPEAEKLARHMATTAPGNQGLRIDYAAALLARGLPRAAERELKAAESLEPSNIELERQQAYVAMQLQEWRQMTLLTDDVIARAPLDRASQQLARVREVHEMSELRISASQGIHSDSPVSGSHDQNMEAAIYGPPLAGRWRPFGGTRFAAGQFEEGKGISRQVFGGVEWRPRDAWAELELSGNHFHAANKPGARLSAWYDFGDHWRSGGSIERMSASTPLRALRNGVSANRGEAWLRWYHSPRREYRFGVAASDFSDHNRRQEYSLEGKERLWQAPGLSLDLLPALSASANSHNDAVYYNPKRDFSAIAALAVDHQLYRRYDTVWSQQLTAGGGSGWQKHYGSAAIAMLGYGQRIRWNNVVDAGLMLNWDKRPYDGKRESNLSVAFDASLRF